MNNNPIKVLLVDDDEDDYILIRDWLSEFQLGECELEWLDNYQLGKNVIADNKHDIYLLDYRLGAENGLELLRVSIEFGCSSPIILLTGRGDRDIDIEAMKAGAADYLEKSQLNAPLLERSIRYALERKQTEQKLREQAALLDVATDAIFVQDLDNKILYWNKAAESLYGWKKNEAIGKKTTEIWQEKKISQIKSAFNTLVKNGYNIVNG